MYQSYMSTFKVGFDAADAATWTDRSASASNGCPLNAVSYTHLTLPTKA